MKAIHLGDLEKKVMDIVWGANGCSIRDIHLQIDKEKKLAYTTVATVVQRLLEKKLVLRKLENGNHIYKPKLTKEQYSKNVARSFLSSFINSYGDVGIASFADTIEKLPSKKRSYFLKLLDTHDKNK